MTYGAIEQLTPEEDTSPSLDNKGTKRFQGIVGAILYYARAVDNKLLVRLSVIGAQQTAPIKRTNEARNKLLDYSATHPIDRILYRSSDIVLCAHSDAGFHNDSKGRIREGAHIFLSKNNPTTKWNGSVLTLAQIIKFVISSATESELGALFITAQEMVSMRDTLKEMRCPQPKLPI